MPSYPVRQPNGKLAVWSTIVDHFIALDCTLDEAVDVLAVRYGNDPRIRADCARIANGEQWIDHWHDWDDCLGWALFRFGEDDETVKDALSLTPDQRLARANARIIYVEGQWQDWEERAKRAESERNRAEAERDALKAQLAAVPEEWRTVDLSYWDKHTGSRLPEGRA